MKSLKQKSSKELMMFLVGFTWIVLIFVALPLNATEVEDCYVHCFEKKGQCDSAVEGSLSDKRKCADDLLNCKMTCQNPREGYHPVRGVQMEFKWKPIIKDIPIPFFGKGK